MPNIPAISRKQAEQAVETGMSQSEMACRFGVSKVTVCRTLAKYGLSERAVAQTREIKRAADAKRDEAIARLVRQGLTYTDIARQIGVNRETVRKVSIRLGLRKPQPAKRVRTARKRAEQKTRAHTFERPARIAAPAPTPKAEPTLLSPPWATVELDCDIIKAGESWSALAEVADRHGHPVTRIVQRAHALRAAA